MKTFTVYKHTTPSGKVYIGITMQTPAKRWGRDGSGYKNNHHFLSAIQKYGWDNIQHEIVAEGLGQKDAEQLEIELIAKYKATDKAHGYNIDKGGTTGPKHSETTKTKIGDANRRRVWSSESRRKVGEASKRRVHNTETRQAMSRAHKGHTHTAEARAKIRAAKQKKVICTDTGVIYNSVEDAALSIGASPSLVAGVCRGVHKTTRGLRFQFISEEVVA